MENKTKIYHTDFDKVHVRNVIRKNHSNKMNYLLKNKKKNYIFIFTSNDFKQYQQNICLQLTHIICAQPAIHSNGKRHRGQRFIFESGSISYGVLEN
jgi:hypothetical protein